MDTEDTVTAAQAAEQMVEQRTRKAAARKVIIREAMLALCDRLLLDTSLTPDYRKRVVEQIDRHREAVISDVGWRDVT